MPAAGTLHPERSKALDPLDVLPTDPQVREFLRAVLPSRNSDERILAYTNAQLRVDAAITWNLGLSGAGLITQNNLDVFAHIRDSIESRD